MNQDPQQPRTGERRADTGQVPDALIVDVGKQSKKNVQRLFAGEGALYGEVKSLMGELRTSGKLPPGAVPVVVVVRQKRRRKKGRLALPGL